MQPADPSSGSCLARRHFSPCLRCDTALRLPLQRERCDTVKKAGTSDVAVLRGPCTDCPSFTGALQEQGRARRRPPLYSAALSVRAKSPGLSCLHGCCKAPCVARTTRAGENAATLTEKAAAVIRRLLPLAAFPGARLLAGPVAGAGGGLAAGSRPESLCLAFPRLPVYLFYNSLKPNRVNSPPCVLVR